MATTEQSTTEPHPVIGADFGANEWLVEEMYERYLADPKSVDAAWHDFFADYRPRTAPRLQWTHCAAARVRHDNGAAEHDCGTAPAARRQTSRSGTGAGPGPDPAPRPSQPAGEEINQLRGAAARVVANMESRCTCRPPPACAPSRPSCSPTTGS